LRHLPPTTTADHHEATTLGDAIIKMGN